jgi:hypothetical protein
MEGGSGNVRSARKIDRVDILRLASYAPLVLLLPTSCPHAVSRWPFIAPAIFCQPCGAAVGKVISRGVSSAGTGDLNSPPATVAERFQMLAKMTVATVLKSSARVEVPRF